MPATLIALNSQLWAAPSVLPPDSPNSLDSYLCQINAKHAISNQKIADEDKTWFEKCGFLI